MNTPPDSFPDPADPGLRFDLTQDPGHGLPVLGIHGALTGTGWTHLAAACSRMTGPLRVLDFTGVTLCRTTSDDAGQFGRQLARQPANHAERPCHVLVAPGDLLFGLCRVIQMNLDMALMKASVVRTTAAATRWLQQENLLPAPPAA